MNPEHIPSQSSFEDSESLLDRFGQYLKDHPDAFKSYGKVESAFVYILRFDPESRLKIIEEKIERGQDTVSLKLTIKNILATAKKALKDGFMTDEILKKAIEDRMLRMETYLSII